MNCTLFGGEIGWRAEDWTSSDDRVRGGKSQSFLRIVDRCAIFEGRLDIETLGGAGFCSQRTTREDGSWNLSKFDGIEIMFNSAKSDNKKYTFILKDEILPPSTGGREQSTTSWEYDFSMENAASVEYDDLLTLYIPWNLFQPTFRGRPKTDGEPFDTSNVKRMSIMMRSFFGIQSGDFRLSLIAIRGVVNCDEKSSVAETDCDESNVLKTNEDTRPEKRKNEPSFWSRILCRG